MIGTKRWLASGQQREHLDKLLLRLVATRRAATPAGLGTLCDYGIGAGEFRPLGIRRVALRRKTRRRRRSCKPRQTRPGSPRIDDTTRGLAANSASQRFAKSCIGALRLLLRPLSATGRKTRASAFLVLRRGGGSGQQIALKAAIAAVAERACPLLLRWRRQLAG